MYESFTIGIRFLRRQISCVNFLIFSGATCSGKTSLACALFNLLPYSLMLCQDDFFKVKVHYITAKPCCICSLAPKSRKERYMM